MTSEREAITHKTTLARLSAAGRRLKSGSCPPAGRADKWGGKNEKVEEKGGKTERTTADLGG